MYEFIKSNLINKSGKINNRRVNKKWFLENGFENEWNQLNSYYKDRDFSETIKTIYYGIKYCMECGIKEIPQNKIYCSSECSNKSNIRIQKIVKNTDYSKRKETMKIRYGHESNFHNPVIQKKVKSTFNEKYDVANISQLESVKEKKRQRVHHTKNDEWRFQRNKKYIESLGINSDDYSKDKILSLSLRKRNRDYTKAVLDNFNEIDSIYDPVFEDISLSKRYTLLNDAGKSHLFRNMISQIHERYIDLLEKNNIEFEVNTRKIISPKELDLYIKKHNLAFEINGSYWHSDKKLDKYYHQNKVIECNKKGIQLYHIFDFNNLEIFDSIINNRLGKSEVIYARECEIKNVDTAEKTQFLNENHLQGNIGSKIQYGLYYNDQLLQCMSFGKSRFTNHDFELLRLCTKRGFRIVGGASRLFSHFLKTNKNCSIISYSSLQFGFSKLYEQLGFTFSHITEPSYYWVKNDLFLSRYQTQKHKLQKLLNNYDDRLTENDNMKKNGFMKIYDCGNQVFHFGQYA